MSCTETIKHLHEFIDREVDRSLYPVIEKHLDHCDDCRQKYEFEKGIRALVKAYCINTTAPAYLRNRIIEGLNSTKGVNTAHQEIETIFKQKPTRILFSARFYAIAASILLLVSGGIFYYENYYNTFNDSLSIVDNAVKNHVVAVNNNLVFNEETSVVGNINKYVRNSTNTKFSNGYPSANTEQISLVGGVPVRFCGTNGSCVVFDKGGNKLSLQTVRNGGFPLRNLERAQLGPKEFYIGKQEGFNSVLWEEDGITYCLTSDINKNEMLQFAATLTSH